MKENKLIAEFMGMSVGQDGWFDYEGVLGDNKCYLDLKFHESWDWLMPVVEKMNTTELWEEYDISHLATCLVSVDINATYDAVVNFIRDNTDTERIMKIRIADMDSDLN
jgi:hypothetical protein